MMKVVFALLGLVVLALAADKPPVFPQSFSVMEVDTMAIHQGQYEQIGDALCCSDDSNCEVQTQEQAGMNYVDAKNQRTRFDQTGSAQSIVTFCGNIQKECLVENGKCVKYCPAQGCEIGGFGPDPNATHVGQTVIDGKTVQIWEWKQTFIGITMQTSDMYIDQSGSSPVPVMQVDKLTPFGEDIGGQNATWSKWQVGVPSAKLFDIQGVESCPQDPNCNSNQRQMARIRGGHMRTYMFYKYGPDAVGAQGKDEL